MSIIRGELEGKIIIESAIDFNLLTAQDYYRFECVTTIDRESELVTNFEELIDSLKEQFELDPNVDPIDLFGDVDINESINGQCVGTVVNSITVDEGTDEELVTYYHNTLDIVVRECIVSFVKNSMKRFVNYGIKGERELV